MNRFCHTNNSNAKTQITPKVRYKPAMDSIDIAVDVSPD